MKHTVKITSILLIMFLLSQLIGLVIIGRYVDASLSNPSGNMGIETASFSAEENITWQPLPLSIERPEVNEGESFIYLAIAVAIGTVLALLLIKFRSMALWRVWFFISVWLTLTIAFAAFINPYIAALLAVALALWKVLKRNVFVHNLTEIFIYAGIAAIIVPMVNLFSAFALLIAISIYDIYAVNKSKHMVKMATFQTKAGLFAGFAVPYTIKKTGEKKNAKIIHSSSKVMKSRSETKTKREKTAGKAKADSSSKTAILGGGDVAFPMIFAGVVMKSLGIWWAAIIPFFVTASLAYLFWKAEKDKFYPAMPFLTVGCILGFLAVVGLRLLI